MIPKNTQLKGGGMHKKLELVLYKFKIHNAHSRWFRDNIKHVMDGRRHCVEP